MALANPPFPTLVGETRSIRSSDAGMRAPNPVPYSQSVALAYRTTRLKWLHVRVREEVCLERQRSGCDAYGSLSMSWNCDVSTGRRRRGRAVDAYRIVCFQLLGWHKGLLPLRNVCVGGHGCCWVGHSSKAAWWLYAAASWSWTSWRGSKSSFTVLS